MALRLGDAGHVQLMLRGRLALASRGPVWSAGVGDVTRMAALRALRRSRPALSGLVINADAPQDRALWRAGFVPVMTPAWVAEWHMAGTDLQRRAALDQKWRNRLVRAEHRALRVIETDFPADPAHWLVQRDAEQQRARGYRGYPGAVAAGYAAANPGHARLFVVEMGGAPVAAALVLVHGRVATYHIGWADAVGRAVQAHNLVLWRASCALSARGVVRFDLGGLDTVAAAGLAHYKLGTGAVARRLGGSWGAVC